MNCIWMFFIIFGVITIGLVIWGIKAYWREKTFTPTAFDILLVLAGIAVVVCLMIGIIQPITLKSEAIRQEKERDQIVYQIENMTEDTDKIKLNEWILTYNDWVNDVNTSKEVYGWFSWYWSFDMSEHEIINLV